MNRSNCARLGLVLMGGLSVWIASLNASDDSITTSNDKHIAELFARIELLEKRVAVLESEKSATRQANLETTEDPRKPNPPTIRWQDSNPIPNRMVPSPPAGDKEWPAPRFRLISYQPKSTRN